MEETLDEEHSVTTNYNDPIEGIESVIEFIVCLADNGVDLRRISPDECGLLICQIIDTLFLHYWIKLDCEQLINILNILRPI